MTEPIDVQKVALLAHLKLTDQEEKYFGEKFEQIIGYVDLLSEVVIEGDPTPKDESLQSLYREDVAIDSGIKIQDFSDKIENQHFMVPSIIE